MIATVLLSSTLRDNTLLVLLRRQEPRATNAAPETLGSCFRRSTATGLEINSNMPRPQQHEAEKAGQAHRRRKAEKERQPNKHQRFDARRAKVGLEAGADKGAVD